MEEIPTHQLTDEQYEVLANDYNGVWIEYKGIPGIVVNHDPCLIENLKEFHLKTIDLKKVSHLQLLNLLLNLNFIWLMRTETYLVLRLLLKVLMKL